MRVELRDVLHAEAWRGGRGFWGSPRSTVGWSALLAVLVVLAAAITGTVHFGGARWTPHFSAGQGRTSTTMTPHHALAGPMRHAAHGGGSFPVWILIVLGVLLAILLLVWLVAGLRWLTALRWLLRMPKRGRAARTIAAEVKPEVQAEPDTPKLRTGIEVALELLDDGERDPADAIVRAWLGLEQTAEDSGIVRQPAETPTELTARILKGAFAEDRAIHTLLRLYLRARFGDHPVTAEEVANVRDALRRLVDTWSAHA